jgi:hypothetical protein
MIKPFQFSMRQMFAAVAWLSVAAACASFVYSHRHDRDGFLNAWLYFASFIAAGAGVGSIFRKVRAGVAIAILCGCIAFVAFVFAAAFIAEAS